ncbi:hypothetical protein A0H81_09557 [Grifola frondosa]|uniref:Uncharacterized protein n=1 Tax=Grifola frondosa TaxID=5627 RepID=A0A1C7M1A4_GRIFR|nr:hypothetical protein A0H81_09557 [Grifola frondosa]
MSSRRRSTIHDLAALRLHRDARDARGNWFAHDAGGIGTVKKRRAGPVHDADRAQEGEVFDLTGVDHGGDASVSSKGKGRAEDSEEPELRRNPRAEKRRKFDEDFSFLTSAAGPSSGLVPHKRIDLHESESRDVFAEGSFPNPSSDLLKCLHYFASSYYSATGQLVDAAREARHERKLRRLERRRRQRIDAGIQSLRSDEEEHDSSTEEEDEQVQHEDDEEDNDDKEGTRARKIGRRRRSKESLYLRDMYKSFDGSALMAIGTHSTPTITEYTRRMGGRNGSSGMCRGNVDPESHSEGRKKKDGEESEPEAESSDSGGSDDNEPEARSSRRVTRGIVQQMSNLPYEDDDDDEDYIP